MSMPNYTPKELMKIIKKHGWQFSHRKSSHVVFTKEGVRDHVNVPDHGKEVCKPLAQRILREAGIAL